MHNICAIWWTLMPFEFSYETAVISISFLLTAILMVAVRRLLVKKAMLDIPNERSSHSIPTPRGGGWAIVAVLVPGLMLTAFLQNSFVEHIGLFLALTVLVGISWQDDRKGVSALRRLSLHILAACLGSLCFPQDHMLFGGALPFALDRTLMIIGWAWFMNLYNFMDGIDGITSTETISIATGLCLVMAAAGISDPFAENLTLLLTGASLGFLLLNWHPAKIFMGDVGSVPLGFLTGFALLSLATQGHLVAAFILPLYYLADSGITLGKRALRGEKIWQAHRQHFYQTSAAGAGRHDHIVFWIIYANIGLIGAAMTSVQHTPLGFGIAIVIVAILLWKMHKTAV